MKTITNRIFILIIAITMIICIVLGVISRMSISTYQYEEAIKNADSYHFYLYENPEFANVFLYDYDLESIDMLEESDYIIRGKITGKREVMQGTVKTEIEVVEEMKGSCRESIIYVYEPIDITLNDSHMILSYDGYNFLKEDREYILCLAKSAEEGAFLYVTPMFAKFPLNYSEDEFPILSFHESEERDVYYSEFVNAEQIFKTGEEKEFYFVHYQILISLEPS